jgi:hypothetical protein
MLECESHFKYQYQDRGASSRTYREKIAKENTPGREEIGGFQALDLIVMFFEALQDG